MTSSLARRLMRRVSRPDLLTMLTIAPLCMLLCALTEAQDTSASLPLDQALTQMEFIATNIETNNAKLERWRGRFEFREYQELSGKAAVDKLELHKVTGRGTQNEDSKLRKEADGAIRFAVDWRRDSLFTTFEMSRPTAFVWKETREPSGIEPHAWLQRSVLTSEEFLHYQPNDRMGATTYFNTDGALSAPAAFRDPPDDGRKEHWSTVVDPRKFLFDPQKELRRTVEIIRDGKLLTPEEARMCLKLTRRDSGDHSIFEFSFRMPVAAGKGREETVVTVFDEEKGFNAVSKTHLDAQENVIMKRTWDYICVNGIYVPSAHGLFTTGPQITFQRDYTLVESEVNGDINPDTFTYKALGIQEGQRFIDNIKEREYVYTSGQLVESTGKALLKKNPEMRAALAKAISQVTPDDPGKGSAAEPEHAKPTQDNAPPPADTPRRFTPLQWMALAGLGVLCAGTALAWIIRSRISSKART